MRHADFAALLPSQKALLIEQAAREFPFPARVVTFTSGVEKTHTYVVLAINEFTDNAEHATFLVMPDHVGPVLARTKRHSGHVFFTDGRYGFNAEREAAQDMFRRVNGALRPNPYAVAA